MPLFSEFMFLTMISSFLVVLMSKLHPRMIPLSQSGLLNAFYHTRARAKTPSSTCSGNLETPHGSHIMRFPTSLLLASIWSYWECLISTSFHLEAVDLQEITLKFNMREYLMIFPPPVSYSDFCPIFSDLSPSCFAFISISFCFYFLYILIHFPSPYLSFRLSISRLAQLKHSHHSINRSLSLFVTHSPSLSLPIPITFCSQHRASDSLPT